MSRRCLSLAALLLLPLVAAAAEPSEKQAAKWKVDDPPGPRESVTIDTRTTTWTNLDVSPLGDTIVFDMLGDIYVVPIEGGQARALTSGIAWDFEPRFSPDGKSIAFISDRGGADNLWLMRADGSDPRALTEEKDHLVHNPYWSPDGRSLAVRKGFTSTRSIPAGEIWRVHVGGGEGLQLVERLHGEQSQKNIAEPAFSPDGRYVYYSQDATPGRVWQYNKDSTGQIFVIKRLDLETGRSETVAGGPGGAIRPTPSPDGASLAFVRRLPGLTSALYLLDLDSGKQRPLYRHLDRDLQEANGSEGNTPAFAWTPDSRQLVFWAGGELHRLDVASGRRETIPLHVRAKLEVQPALRFPVEVSPSRAPARMLRWAQRSPDGRHAVFQALGRLWIEDLEAGRARRLSEVEDRFEFYPAFSRDGKRLAFTTWNDETLGEVRVLDLDGGEERVVTRTPARYVEPSFGPEGKRLVYRRITGGYLLAADGSLGAGIYLADLEKGATRRLLDHGFAPHFGASADRVFFSEVVETTQLALKSVDRLGHDERTHLQGKTVTSFAVAPDGGHVAFVEQHKVFVAPLLSSGKKQVIGPKSKALPVRQVSADAGSWLHWSADGGRLGWSHGRRLFEADIEQVFAADDRTASEATPKAVATTLHLELQPPAAGGLVAIVGARLVTMRDAESTKEVIEDGTVLIEGERIRAVGRRSAIDVPREAFVIDGSGLTVIPGLVDVHAHGAMARSQITPQQNWMQYSNLSFGVTTIHDPSNDTASIFAMAEMQRAGVALGPRIYSTGTILYGAHEPRYTARIGSLDDATYHVRRLQEVGAISVKSYQQPGRDQRQQIIAAGRELGMMVVPEGGARFQHNLTEIVDGHTGIEHAVPVARVYDDVLQLWSQTEVGYTPTLGVAYGGISGENYWYDRTQVWKDAKLMRFSPRSVIEPRAMRRPRAPDDHYNHIEAARTAHALRQRGVRVQLGAHGQREGLAAHWELWMLEQGGFSPWEALRAGTIDGAHYVGLDREIGSIEAGKLADLALIRGNPLEDLRLSERVAYTVLGGRVFDAATMNQLAPEARERRPFFFEREGGDTVHPDTTSWLERLSHALGWSH